MQSSMSSLQGRTLQTQVTGHCFYLILWRVYTFPEPSARAPML